MGLVGRGLRDPRSLYGKFRRIRRTYRDWPLYWAIRILGGPHERVYHLRAGPRIWLRTGTVDFYVVDEVFRRTAYGPVAGWVGARDIVVDVGAHIGAYALWAARRASHGTVVAVEPHPGNYEQLRRNVSLNGLRNVIPVRAAVGAITGRRALFLSEYNVGGHSFYRRSSRSLEVDTITIEDLLARHHLPRIDVLKLDCEGAEHEILESLPADLRSRIRKISLEYHELDASRTAASVARQLEGAGFEVLWTQGARVLHARRQ